MKLKKLYIIDWICKDENLVYPAIGVKDMDSLLNSI
jgi:hypothetical protein